MIDYFSHIPIFNPPLRSGRGVIGKPFIRQSFSLSVRQSIIPSVTRVRSISPEPFERFSLNFTQMFLSVRRCAEHMTQLPRIKVKGFTLEFRIHSISPEPLGRFSLSFTQMFLLVRQCAEFMTRLHRLKVKVTLQSHGIYP